MRLAIWKARFKRLDFNSTKSTLTKSIQQKLLQTNRMLYVYYRIPFMYKTFFSLILLIHSTFLAAQRLPDHVYNPDIRTVKLFKQNIQKSLPLIKLNSNDLLELHFDDLCGYAKNYFYTLQLCNADWSPATDVNVFDYLTGFTQNRLSQYRISSVSLTKYVHYQALLPERNCMPTKSGNYLLKVFLDSDTAKLAFTKRLLVVDEKALVGGRVEQPFDNEFGNSHQKIQVSVNTLKLNILSPQQVKMVILQNNRWDNAVKNIQPSFIRGVMYEYNGEKDCLFPAGKEYRWADLRSFRFQSDRIDRVDKWVQPMEVYIKPDVERNDLRYLYFLDQNGWDEISSTESINPWWQSEYANVTFTFVPKNNQPYPGNTMYLLGSFTGNQVGDTSKMYYDAKNGVYTKRLFLKQGYYSYTYVTKDTRNTNNQADASLTDGNYWETENAYTILFYYRSFSSRHDELLGMSTINSRFDKIGF